jgi:hypothetical protein
MSFLSNARSAKLRNSYINGFLDCSGDIVLRSGNVIIGNISQPGYNANQMSLFVNGRTEMNGNLIVNGNLNIGGLTRLNGGSQGLWINVTSVLANPPNSWYGSYVFINSSVTTDLNQTIPTGVGNTSRIIIYNDSDTPQTITSPNSVFYGCGYFGSASLKLRRRELVSITSDTFNWFVVSDTNVNPGQRTLISRTGNGTQTTGNGAIVTALFPTDLQSGSQTGMDYTTANGRFTNNRGCSIVCNISGCIAFSANATGNRAAWILLSNGQRLQTVNVPANASGVEGTNIPFTANTKFANGEFFTIQVYQTSGATLTLLDNEYAQTMCTVLITETC